MPTADKLSAALAGRYRIERELGAGGMATVYLAHDEKHDRKVAIKVLKPELAAVLGADRFVVEIKTTASLNHPHILPLFDSGTADGFLFYVMPFIEGETIRDKLTRESQFGVDEAIRIAREIADALDYAHRHGVIHRDIKPENILLHDGRAMVMDFGIALAVSAAAGGRMTETGLSLGTPHYMSPEQATAEKEISPRSDEYSLASVLYEMLAGQPPHVGGPAQQVIMRIITEPARPVSEFRKNVPSNVVAALARSLEKLPADRFESAKAFADALGNPFYGASAPGTNAATTSARPARRWWMAAAAITLTVGALGWMAGRNVGSANSTPATYSPLRLGGPPVAMAPRLSPDGTMLAYVALVGGTSQVGVLNLASGDWRILTHDTTSGVAQQPTWTPDGSRILFARVPADAPKGIYAVSPSGDGSERLIFPDACAPAALADGSLLALRFDDKRLLRLYHYFPQTGRIDTLPVHSTPTCSSVGQVTDLIPGDREAIVVGGTGASRAVDSLLAVDLSTHRVRALWTGPVGRPSFGLQSRTFRATPDGRAVLYPLNTDDGYAILRIPTDGSGRPVPLFSIAARMDGIDVGKDGTVYVDQSANPFQVTIYDPRTRERTTLPGDHERSHGLALPDGRILVAAPAGRATRIVALARGRDPVGFLATGEEAAAPIALLGNDRVMMHTRGDSGASLTIAYLSNGRIAGRIQRFNHNSIAGSADGKTIYYADSGAIWAMPSTGGAARKLRAGDGLAASPDGKFLMVTEATADGVRLFKFPLDGSAEQEVKMQGPWAIAVAELEANAVAPDGRVVARVSTPSRWAWPTGIIDPRTGSITVVPPGPDLDGYGGWGPNGTVVTFGWETVGRLWAFTPSVAQLRR